MQDEIKSILNLVKEYLSIKVADLKNQKEKKIRWSKQADKLLNLIERKGGIELLIQYLIDVFDISFLKGDIDKRKKVNLSNKEKDDLAKEITLNMENDPIPYLVSTINDDLIINISEIYGIISEKHPLKLIPTIQLCNQEIVEDFITLLTSKNKTDIIISYNKINNHNISKILEFGFILINFLSDAGKKCLVLLINDYLK